MKIKKQLFGTLADGTKIALYTLVNDNGMRATITNYGGIVVSLTAPDRDGNFEDVVLGFDTLKEYVEHNPFFGCLVGRYGNRIGALPYTVVVGRDGRVLRMHQGILSEADALAIIHEHL